MKKICSLIVLLCSLSLSAQPKNPLIDPHNLERQNKWVDSIYQNMSLKEKIGQLYMLDIFSQAPKASTNKIKEWIRDYHIGGVIFSKGGPGRQAVLNNEYQALSKVPLLIGMDAEWGLAMRLDSTFAYPWNMTLGAVQNNMLIKQVGERIGEHAKRLGVHINFAPSVDINNNPLNPIIGNRSFGENPEQVTQKAHAFATGMSSVGVLNSLKHFPGHGNTDQDSHLLLPKIEGTRQALDSIELYPFRQLLQQNVASSVMTSHLSVPGLEPNPKLASSLSKAIITDLLKETYGFEGLIITDAMNMKGATDGLAPGEADLKAFLAGTDLLLIPQNLPASQSLLLKAYNDGTISEERLAHSVKKLLAAKYKVGLNNYQAVKLDGLYEDLNSVIDTTLYQKVMAEAISLLKNKEEVLPFKNLDTKKIAYISFGDESGDTFLKTLKKYANITQIKASTALEYNQALASYTDVIIGFHKRSDNPWRSYKFSVTELNLINDISKKNRVHLVSFTSPYALLDLDASNIASLIVAYQNSVLTQEIAPQILFGAIGAKGKLPVGAGKGFPAGHGLHTTAINRLSYGTPESVGVDGKILSKIDSMVAEGLKQGMMPGAQVLVARGGKVIYEKSFGKHRYTGNREVENQDVYDLASLTKILATLPMIMELVDKEVLSLETRLDQMLPEYKGTNKGSIKLIDLLTHYNQLQSWIPFYRETLDSKTNTPSDAYYKNTASDKFGLSVADKLYIRTDYKDSIYKRILESDLRAKKNYRYSDLPFYILQKYIEKHYGESLDKLVETHFYNSLGADMLTYLPLNKFPKDQIPPTEKDTYFRHQEIQGYVHDQGAAMMGGVSGHAGLFGNANDVAKMMQMYVWEGRYGSKEYISPDTFRVFNTCYYCDKDVRRGIGFDKPQLGNVGPTCGCVSMTSFGHSGFTGTFAWADPEEDIVYVFLSNRTFPDAENSKIIQSNLRSNIQAVIYEAIKDSFVY